MPQGFCHSVAADFYILLRNFAARAFSANKMIVSLRDLHYNRAIKRKGTRIMIIMSVDLGKARTGIAICDKTEFLASPYTVIFEKSPAKLLEKVVQAAIDTKAERIVVGLPKNMDGSEGGRKRHHRHGAYFSERHQHARQKKKKRRRRGRRDDYFTGLSGFPKKERGLTRKNTPIPFWNRGEIVPVTISSSSACRCRR